jgi:hypothetical protein
MRQFEFTFPVERKQNAERKPTPPCDECKARGFARTNHKCKPCKAAYLREWRGDNPGRWAEIVDRSYKKNSGVLVKKKRKRPQGFKERYASDPEFRQKHRERVQHNFYSDPEKAARKLAEKRERAKRYDHEQIVYFIRSELTGLVKIGTTISLRKRMSSLRNSHPGALTVLGTMPGTNQTESDIHHLFASDRIDREWFKASIRLESFITSNTNRGERERVAEEATA